MISKVSDRLQQSGIKSGKSANKLNLQRKQTNQSSLNGKHSKLGTQNPVIISKNIDISKIEEKKYKDEEQKKLEIKKNRSLLTRNFEIFIDLLKFKKTSIEKSYILISIAFIQIYISNVSNYKNLMNKHYTIASDNLSTVINVISYVDITTVLQFNSTMYMVMLFVSSAYMVFTLALYVTCYFIRASNENIKVRKFFYGRWFLYLCEYLQWILLQPIYITLISYITCYQPVQSNLNIQCNTSDSLFFIKIAVICLGLLAGSFTVWYTTMFLFNGSFSSKKDTLACDNTIYILQFNIYRILFSLVICLRSDSYFYFIGYLLYNFLFSAYLSYQFYLNQGLMTFKNKYVRNLFKLLMVLLFSQNIALLLDELQRSLSILKSQTSENNIQFTIIFFVFVFYFYRKIARYQQQKMIIGNDLRNLSYKDFAKRVYYLQTLLENSSDSLFQEVYFKGIISQHLNNPCNHIDSNFQKCFCQTKILHDSKKVKDVNIDKCYIQINKSIVSKFIVKSWYEQFISLNQNNFTVLIDYSEFIFNKFRNPCLSLTVIQFLKKKYLYPIDQYRLFRLIHFIHKYNRKKNVTSYKGILNVENVIPIELKIDRIKYKIKQILLQNISFWNMLLKNVIVLEELNQAIKKVFEDIDEIKKMWIRVIVYLNYRKKWRFYYAWYYLYILNQKVLLSLLEKFTGTFVNENEVFIEEYQTDQVEDDLGSVVSNSKEEQDKIKIKKVEMAFDRRSCVFRVASDNLGKIIKVNKPVLTTFGFNRYELENHVFVTDLMPKSFAILHPKYTSNYISTGKSKILYSQKKVYCVQKKGNVFSGWKFLKLFVNLHGIAEFVCLIRPILNPAGSKLNYIIFNDDWEVDSMSQLLYEYFMIDSELYRQQMIQLANLKLKKEIQNAGGKPPQFDNKVSTASVLQNGMVLNLLLVIPKLMKFSRLFQFLTIEDQQNFGIIPKKAQLGDIANIFKNRFNQEGKQNIFAFDKLKSMAKQKKSLAQQSLAAKKAALFAQENGEKNENQDNEQNGDVNNAKLIQQNTKNENQYKIQHYLPDQNDSKSNGQNPQFKINDTTPQKPSKINLTLTQDDSAAQLLDLKSKNKETFEDQIIPSPKQLDAFRKQFTHQASNVSSSVQQNSLLEIQEQLDEKQQDLIKKQMEKATYAIRRKTLHQMDQNDEDEEKAKSDKDDSTDDDDIETEFGLENLDENGNKQKDERLEKGEQVRLVARIPHNIAQVMQSYYTMSQSRLKKYDEKTEKRKNTEVASSKQDMTNKIKTYTNNSNFTIKESQTNINSYKKHETQTERVSGQKDDTDLQYQRDKAFYQLIKDAFTLHIKRKKSRQLKLVCTTKFKKMGQKKIGIMKILNLEEIKIHKLNALQQVQQKNKEFEVSLSKQFSDIKDGIDLNGLTFNNGKGSSTKNLDIPNNNQSRFSINKNALLNNIKNTLAPLNSHVSAGNNSFQDLTLEVQDSKVQSNQFQSKENGMGYQLDNFDSDKQDENLKDIQKDFEKKQGSVTFNLSYTDNIFIKEDIHQPREQLNSIFQLQLFTRLFFFFILLFNVLSYFVGVNNFFNTVQNYTSIVQLVKVWNLNVLAGYDVVLNQVILNSGNFTNSILKNTYYQNQAGFQNEINQVFYNITGYFQNVTMQNNFQETLFGLSQKNVTTSIVSYSQGYGNYTYDVFDMFQQYVYHINELNNTMYSSQTASITTQSDYVNFIRQNAIPYLNNDIYDLGQSSMQVVSDTISQITQFVVIITIVLSSLVGISFLFMWKLTKQICDSFSSIFDSFEKIDLVDVKKITDYYGIILNQFSYAVDKDEYYSRAYMPITNQLLVESEYQEKEEDVLSNNQPIQQGSNLQNNAQTPQIKSEHTRATMDVTRMSNQNPKIAAALLKVSDLQLEASDDNAMVKKNKQIEEGDFLKDLKIKIIVYYLIFMICLICFSCVYVLQVYLNQNTLQMMKEDGLTIINPITLDLIMIISVKENFIDPGFYQDYLYQYASPYVSMFFDIKQDVVLNSLSSYSYNYMYNQVYKTTACNSDIAPSILSQNQIVDCQTILQNALNNGLNIFGTKFTEFVSNYQSLPSLKSATISSTILSDMISYSRGVYYADIFNNQIMNTWQSNISSNISSIVMFCTILVIVAGAFMLIIYIVINEYLILGRLKREYVYFRTVYKMYFPEAIVTKKKSIKYWLIKQGILKRK
ncbi:transmembrane protein, putative (macronuclear) [Tetrahymena thermophila SB210]|uniref:Transmembrane protein, putative n=1 Tax=Tetrahymena thermophila (strain SB210) TaxID=312017 RepID=Q23CS0_TETTS|nr:transmembrane protein, putative [Tetrahymena thermophila SB210]EAR94555.2 transmembrane protein, putative [Tetrahymena thermophila SB210]|eukprot:XP_001014966.2 transmembrane protein, putative [Tetrahymena thermophila SB210]